MKKRIIIWVIFLAIAVGYIAFYEYRKSLPVEDTTNNKLHIYNDVTSETLVKRVFDKSELASKYTVKFENDSDDADFIIAKKAEELLSDDGDKTLITTSYTPLIICMKNSKNLEKYQKKGLLNSAKDIDNSVEDAITIDFKKLIDAVINGDNWSVFGGENNDFKIIVPENDSVEGKIFYNFLLVTINNGNYPSNDEVLKSAKETADKFLESCVKTENAINDLKQINSINATDVYVFFEADFMNSSIWSQKKLDISVVYPKVTLVKHMYIQVIKEEYEEFETFSHLLSKELNYRTSTNTYSFAEDKNYNVNDDIIFVEVTEDSESSKSPLGIGTATLIIIIVLLIIIFISTI